MFKKFFPTPPHGNGAGYIDLIVAFVFKILVILILLIRQLPDDKAFALQVLFLAR